jgi:hypothetical protein
MKLAIYILFFLTLACSQEQIPCNSKCGKLYDVRHIRELQEVRYIFITECGDTITNNSQLNPVQLANDNGVSYFVQKFDFEKQFCE